MKKTLLSVTLGLACLAMASRSEAQSVFTADLELIPETDVTGFTLNLGDSLDVGMRVINHGPDDIDTSGYVLWGFNDFPYNLVVQGSDGLIPIPSGDTVVSLGIRFLYTEEYPFERDTTMEICYYLKTNLDPDEFITDTNQENDTFCFTITYKGEAPSALGQVRNGKTDIAIFPNPATDMVHVPLDAKNRGMLEITVFTADGRVYHREQLAAGSKQEAVLATGQWPRGLYFVKVQSGADASTGKFLLR